MKKEQKMEERKRKTIKESSMEGKLIKDKRRKRNKEVKKKK